MSATVTSNGPLLVFSYPDGQRSHARRSTVYEERVMCAEFKGSLVTHRDYSDGGSAEWVVVAFVAHAPGERNVSATFNTREDADRFHDALMSAVIEAGQWRRG